MPADTASDPHARDRCADGAALGDGLARDALREALQQLAQAESVRGAAQAPCMCHALTEAARALAGLHAYGPAETYLAQARRWAAVMGGHDLLADLACAGAEVATNAADLSEARGDASQCRAERSRARQQAFEAARLAGRATDPNWEIRVLLRASDVLDRCGEHDDAVQLQQRAMALMGLGQAELPVDDDLPTAPSLDPGPLTAPGALM